MKRWFLQLGRCCACPGPLLRPCFSERFTTSLPVQYATIRWSSNSRESFSDILGKEDKEEDVNVRNTFKSQLQKLDPLPSKQETLERNKLVFKGLVNSYIKKEHLYRRGHVEFAREAMKQMKDYGVHKDMSCYKKLLEVFPEDIMVCRTVWQWEFMHYPKQQMCVIDMLDLMSESFIIPDEEFQTLIIARFGNRSKVYTKVARMLYWFPKFKNANPFPLPRDLPEDPVQLAILALKKMSVDLENKITVWHTAEKELEPMDDTFIASAQSPTQQGLISRHAKQKNKPLYVEGGFSIWLRDVPVIYYILRADPNPDITNENTKNKDDDEDLFNWIPFYESEENTDIAVAPSVHEQDDGTIMATCVTGTRSRDSLITWIRYLQKTNPALEHIPVIFNLQSLPGLEEQDKLIENNTA